ncbi:unnamed protein product [Urochloa decumbens]|uniref:Uncharacterized protein n=1 Tax=Urochloa decumbens TaxID=240449 RepID=A0ABC8XU12_9POAL
MMPPNPPNTEAQIVQYNQIKQASGFSSVVAVAAEDRPDDARPAVRVEADDEPDQDEDGHPDDDVQRQVRPGLRHDEGEHEAGVRHRERPHDVARAHGQPRQQAQRHHHGARDADPARDPEHPVPRPVQVAHDRVAGVVERHLLAVPPRRRVLLPVAAGHAEAEQVGERREQRGHQQQRAGVVRRPASHVFVVRRGAELLVAAHGQALRRRVRGDEDGLHVARGRRCAFIHGRVLIHGHTHVVD